MRFGVAFANVGPFVEPEAACRLARAAEASGFDSVWTVDHVVVPTGYRSAYPYDPSGRLPSGEDAPFPDPLVWLAYVARETRTVRLATGILVLPQRNPLVLAKQLATLDVLSGGRVTLGVGIGWLEEEYRALGAAFEGRGERLEEYVAAMRALWSEDRATFRGRDVAFRDSVLRPQPVRGTIPVLVGGHSEVAARRAGRMGDGFFPFGVAGDRLGHLLAVMREAAGRAGRDPSSVEVTVSSTTVDPAPALDELEALASMGVDRVVVPAALFRQDVEDGLARYGREVAAAAGGGTLVPERSPT
ncbi:MAG: LLM class F420-dependent oxidoreductase [Acidimicrobiales bacterium]